jgi:hypothetical protein
LTQGCENGQRATLRGGESEAERLGRGEADEGRNDQNADWDAALHAAGNLRIEFPEYYLKISSLKLSTCLSFRLAILNQCLSGNLVHVRGGKKERNKHPVFFFLYLKAGWLGDETIEIGIMCVVATTSGGNVQHFTARSCKFPCERARF